MIDLSKLEPVKARANRRRNTTRAGFDVKVAVRRHGKAGLATVITIYDEKNVRKFQNHSVTPYISRDKIVLVIDDNHGYAFSQIKRGDGTRNMDYGTIKIANDKLNLLCIANEGKYVLKRDPDSGFHYINLKEKVFGKDEANGT